MRQKSARKFYSSPNAKLKSSCQLKVVEECYVIFFCMNTNEYFVSPFFIFPKIANESTINIKCSRKYRFSAKLKEE